MQFKLEYSEIVQGEFTPTEFNLMMVFQVNCPGCFIYGIPQMLALHNDFSPKISFYLLSTAFEDFSLNTLANTQSLVHDGKLVGETRKALDEHCIKWQTKIPFPVLWDEPLTSNQLCDETFLRSIIGNHLQLSKATKNEQYTVVESLRQHYRQVEQCGYTFSANLLQGTPSFILFDKGMDTRLQWFGHASEEVVRQHLMKIIN